MNQFLIYCYIISSVFVIFLYRKLGLLKAILIALCSPLLLFAVGVVILLIYGDR